MTAPTALHLHAEIEAPLPLRAANGELHLTGWCLAEGMDEPPLVRLRTDTGVLPLTARLKRTDVPGFFPNHPAATRCGFVIEGRLPAGVHLAHFETCAPDGSWQVFKSLSLAADSRPFAAAIEASATTGTVSRRVHLEGWALHPSQPVAKLTLRYGHQEIPCRTGLPRADVPALYPESSHAGESGFRSRTILSAGHGPLRLKARLADGSSAVARTGLVIDVATDENHGPDLDLKAGRVALPGYTRRIPEPAPGTDAPLNILFVLHGDFTANSTLQACALANELADAGHACAIAVPRDLETIQHQIAPCFRACLHEQAVATGGGFPDGRGPDVIHAWTTREQVRRTATGVQQRHGGRLCVQLEDNEHEILTQATGRSFAELAALPDSELDSLLSPDLAHPRLSRDFLANADGVTVIVDRLREFVPAGKPCVTVWPAADARYFFPRPLPQEFRRLLDVSPENTVLFYHGNVHRANAGEMRELYAAVARLNEAGQPVSLLRAGVDQVDFLGDLAPRVRPHVLELGQIINHRHLPPLMALADLFVQPGAPDAFNDYRFPSKLPEFFSIGRPVILPRTNLGESLRHGVDACVLDRANAAGIVKAVTALRRDHTLATRLGEGAVAFAAAHFSWRRSAAALANLYATLTRS